VGLVQYEPLDYRIYQLMGVIQHQQKRHALALALYHAAIAVHAGDGLSHMYAGECLLHLARKDEGLVEIRAGVDLLKTNPAYLAYAKRGENVLAIQSKK
jgi:tetratricopeptide (TPR) repeat protein